MARPTGFIEITIIEHSREPNLRVPPPQAGSKRLLNTDRIVTIQPETRTERPLIKSIIWLDNDTILGVVETYDSFK